MGKMVDNDKLRVLRKMAANKESMLNKEGINQLDTIRQYAGRGELPELPKSVTQVGMKALGEASDEVSDKVAGSLMEQTLKKLGKGGAKAAGLALGPIGLMASGVAEAFDAQDAGGKGSDLAYDQRKSLPSDIKASLVSEDAPMGGLTKDNYMKKLLRKASQKREDRLRDSQNLPVDRELLDMKDEVEDMETTEKELQRDGLRKALMDAAKESQSPNMKEKYLQMMRRR